MLKKKNIAMVMAAATVATSVAPVFAAQVEDKNVDEATLIAEVEKMLNTKYFDADEDGDGDNTTKATTPGSEYTNSVYEIKAGATDIKTVGQLRVLIEQHKESKTELKLTVTDKGHQTVNGRIVATERTVNSYYTKADLFAVENTGVAGIITKVEKYNANGIETTGDSANSVTVDNITKVVITLASGKTIELTTNDYKLDLKKPIDANGNSVSIDATGSVAKRVDGFKKVEGALADIDLPSKSLDNLVFNQAETKTVDFKIEQFLTGEGYTKDAESLRQFLTTSNIGTSADIVSNGKEYKVKFVNDDTNMKIEAVKDGGYQLVISLAVVENKTGAVLPTNNNVKLVITSNVQADLVTLKGAIVKDALPAFDYKKLAGDNRFETAVAVSAERFVSKTASELNKAESIVLVGENAVVDGLASAPLASEKKAPILLTKKDAVPTSTMDEINRVVAKGSTVYIVGGENTISKDVEAQLIKEMNAKIVRLAGDNRYDTSLKIAKKLTTAVNNAYVVGGEGLADAMSIAAVASQQKAPIIVSPEAGLTQDAKDYLYTHKNANVDVVGGVSKVSEQVIKDIEANTNISEVERIAGSNRNDTNAKVLTKYFVDATGLDKVYVAKDADAQLVDALAAAPLAGSTDKGAIVLATNDLSASQEKALKAKTSTVANNELTQIGNGIASTVMQKVLKALGL